jgi:hypothetical protein
VGRPEAIARCLLFLGGWSLGPHEFKSQPQILVELLKGASDPHSASWIVCLPWE